MSSLVDVLLVPIGSEMTKKNISAVSTQAQSICIIGLHGFYLKAYTVLISLRDN